MPIYTPTPEEEPMTKYMGGGFKFEAQHRQVKKTDTAGGR